MKPIQRQLTTCAVLLLLAPTAFASDDSDVVHSCDEYAAHPNDPNRWAIGVIDEKIIPGPAVKFCREAVAAFPDTLRFQFQLGRALWAANNFEEGLKYFMQVGDQNTYGPAYHYLGDATFYGIANVEVDEELALNLYEVSAGSGFLPSVELLENFQNANLQIEIVEEESISENTVVNPSISLQQQSIPPPTTVAFDASIFLEPDIVTGLFNGAFELVNKGETKTFQDDMALHYMQGFLTQFSQDFNINDATNSCADLYRPALSQELNFRIARGQRGSEILFGGNLDDTAKFGFEVMADMAGLLTGDGVMNSNMMQVAKRIGLLSANGQKDGLRLIKRHGCNSDVVKRIFANVSAFISGSSPIVSEAERKRQTEIAAQEKRRVEAERLMVIQTNAKDGCETTFKKSDFCACLIKSLKKQNLNQSDWIAISNNFREVIAIAKRNKEISGSLRSCRTG